MKSQLLRHSDFYQKTSFLLKRLALVLVFAISIKPSQGQAPEFEVFAAGSFVINMGVTPQTVGNALKPYGMIYDLINNYGVPIKWIINPDKVKDGIDFSHEGFDYRGGPFIISAEYRNAVVNGRIAFWQTQGVIGNTTNTPLSVPVFKTLTVSSSPRWTLDKQNGKIALPFFANAGIPPSAHGGLTNTLWKLPADLNDCDDIFVMPHADPLWSTHQNLLPWNLNSKGSIWLGCHAGSALENLFNPSNPSQQMNFLSNKVTTPGPGIVLPPSIVTVAYAQNSLIVWTNHDDGTPPYSYSNPADPIMQFMGIMDAATLNGSEQIFIPVNGVNSGWRSTTVTGVFDPDHPERASNEERHRAAVLAYGRGFGDVNRGYVMMQGAHNIAGGTTPANIAAQRAFFNFSFLSSKVKSPDPQVTTDFTTILSGTTQTLGFSVQPPRYIEEFTVAWSSTCGGTFSPASPPSPTSIQFTAPIVTSPINCDVTITLTDLCGRVYKSTSIVPVVCGITVTTVATPACFGQSNGSIAMNITGASGPFVWTWNRSGGGSGSGSGTTISGLAPGSYRVTVTANNGTGCSNTFTTSVVQNPQIFATASPVNVLCFGGTGGVNLTVTGGTPGYTYSWTKSPSPTVIATSQNLSGVTPGTYNVTVTDSRNCTATASATVTQPAAISFNPSVINLLCNGVSTGSINPQVSGGTPNYTYLWNDGNTSAIRNNLAAGNYSVIVTDANGCSANSGTITVTQPTAITASANAPAIGCNGGNTTITVTASGGTGTLEYSLNGGTYQSSNQFTGVTASPTPYIITVRDANLCTRTTSITVTQPAPIQISAAVTPEFCTGDNDGAITLTVTGGTGPYTFNWTDLTPPPVEPQNRTGLAGGTYSVTVTDANNCSATLSNIMVPVTNPEPVAPGSINH